MAPGTDVNDLLPDTALTGPNGITSAPAVLKEPMLKALPATFSWPQLITALIGGGIALLIVPVIRKALHR